MEIKYKRRVPLGEATWSTMRAIYAIGHLLHSGAGWPGAGEPQSALANLLCNTNCKTMAKLFHLHYSIFAAPQPGQDQQVVWFESLSLENSATLIMFLECSCNRPLTESD